MSLYAKLRAVFAPPPPPPSIVPQERGMIMSSALYKANETTERRFPIQPPVLPLGVIPKDKKVQVIGMDSGGATVYDYARAYIGNAIEGFPGYPYLAALATRAEYRAFASTLSKEMTREWITVASSDTAGDETKKKVTEITQEFTKLNVQGIIQEIVSNDCFFGRGQIFVDIEGHDRSLPLILSAKTIKKESLKGFKSIEPMWTTPSSYNALDPAAPDFYKPTKWFMLGQEVHASRLLTIITRPVPDIFKPAFNFSGMSLSQLAEAYVNNWLRTRQSVADLINNFSVTALKTSMGQVLQGGDNGENLFLRAKLFTATRSNKGLMLLDKETEELVQTNVPLGGLSELQAQSQEHMCSVSKLPAILLTGISPTGLNASSDGEIRVHYDNIAADQGAFYRDPIEIMLKVVQLHLYGTIDPEIIFTFNPLYQMSAKELSDIRKANAETAGTLIDRGVIDPQEERERLARDPESGYQGLDVEDMPEAPDPNVEEEEEEANV